MSVCGVFIVQYFPIRAFSMADEEMGFLVDAGNILVNVALLATAVASPVVICLWASVLFVAGMINYILESDLGGLRYRIFAAVPVGFGVITVMMTLILGETIDRRMRAKVPLLFCSFAPWLVTDESWWTQYYPQGFSVKLSDQVNVGQFSC